MKEMKRILAVVLTAVILCVGGFAQKGNDNRPPKDNPKIVDKDKEKPPPNNGNSQNNNSNRRGKP